MARKKKLTILSNVAEAYKERYPDDEMGQRLSVAPTFLSLLNGMVNGSDFYHIIFGNREDCDSLVRERIFEMLSKVAVLPYEIIYQIWIKRGIGRGVQ